MMNSHRCAHSTPAQLRAAMCCATSDLQLVWLQSVRECAEDCVMKNVVSFPSLAPAVDAERIGYELAKDSAMTLPQRAIVIQCCAGMLWLTIAGDAADYFLCAGESITCRKNHTVVVEAMFDVARFWIAITKNTHPGVSI